MRSINRAPFSSSCINISGDEETNRSAFDLLLATQKWGLAALSQAGPLLHARHLRIHRAMGNTRWQGQPLPTGATHRGGGDTVWAREQSPVSARSTPHHPLLVVPGNGRTWSSQHLFLGTAGDTRFRHRQAPPTGKSVQSLQEQVGCSSGWKSWGLSGLVPFKSPPNIPCVYSFKCSFVEHIILGPRTLSSSSLPTGF